MKQTFFYRRTQEHVFTHYIEASSREEAQRIGDQLMRDHELQADVTDLENTVWRTKEMEAA